MNCGIYKIESPSGKIYIGSSENLKIRFGRHKSDLTKGRHVNKKLQNAWNKYNGEGFLFSKIIIYSKQDTIFYEQIAFNAFNPEYNLLPVAGKSTGWKHSQETRKKLSDSHIGGPGGGMTGHKHTAESNEKNRIAHIGKPGVNLGVPCPEERKMRISEKLKGYGLGSKRPKEQGEKISQSHKKSGHKPSALAIQASIDSRKGKKQSEETKRKRLASYLTTVEKRNANKGL